MTSFLTYGSPRSKENIKEIIELFNEVEKIILEMINE